MFDNLKAYFKNMPCYWSANLFAMAGFLALLMVTVFIPTVFYLTLMVIMSIL